jgi:hypothetical protein
MVATRLGKGGVKPLADTRWPRKFTSGRAKVLFSKLITSLAAWRRRNTSSTSRWCCYMEGLAIIVIEVDESE